MPNQQLIDYIKQQIAQGVEKDQIQKSLMASGGWSEKDISDVFSAIANSIKPPQPPTPLGAQPLDMTGQDIKEEQETNKYAFWGRRLGYMSALCIPFLVASVSFTDFDPSIILPLVLITSIFLILALFFSIVGYRENRKNLNMDKKVAMKIFVKSNIGLEIIWYIFLFCLADVLLIVLFM